MRRRMNNKVDKALSKALTEIAEEGPNKSMVSVLCVQASRDFSKDSDVEEGV